jgi:hypothetical protein
MVFRTGEGEETGGGGRSAENINGTDSIKIKPNCFPNIFGQTYKMFFKFFPTVPGIMYDLSIF